MIHRNEIKHNERSTYHTYVVTIEERLRELGRLRPCRCAFVFRHVFENHVYARQRVDKRRGHLRIHLEYRGLRRRTNKVIEPQERPGELALALHDDPDARADAAVDELEGEDLRGHDVMVVRAVVDRGYRSWLSFHHNMSSDAFNSAAAYLASSSPSPSPSPSTQTKLELYALYKYVTSGPKPTTTRPGLFDWTGRAKWDAWDQLGGTDIDEKEAQERYMRIATGLGWPGPSFDIPKEEQEEDIIDWDNLDSSEPSTSTSKGAGFGVSVSTMRRPDGLDDTEDTEDGDGDVNAIDEYVCFPPSRGLSDMESLL